MLGEARELGVHLELHPRGQEAEPFQQALDIRIRALETFQPQPARDLGKFPGEFSAHFAQVLQFPVVVFEQPGIHQRPLARLDSSTLTWPLSRSISVLRYNCRGNGCAHRSPSISKVRALWLIRSSVSAA